MTTRELELLQGTLDVLVLRALSWGPKHGYAVARFIRDGSKEAFKVLDGALYTSLHRMEERGWVESEWSQSEKNHRDRTYKLTPAGGKQPKQEIADFERMLDTILLVMEPSRGGS